MVERTPLLDLFTHGLMLVGIFLLCFPVYLALVAATHDVETVNRLPMPIAPGGQLFANLAQAWGDGDLGRQLWNTFVQAFGIAVGKIVISILSAYAIVYFRFPFRMTAFWLVFMSLMLPIEVRIVPTYEVAANAMTPIVWIAKQVGLGAVIDLDIKVSLLNSYWGLILPIIASATATFLFRQFFLTVPDELVEAAKMDGAGPLRFFWDILLPLSRTTIAALAVIMFIVGWNQFLWPLLITTEPDYRTAVIGLAQMMPGPDTLPEWNTAMAAALLVMLPPILVIAFLQRLFVRGLIASEK
ncbi:MAG: ABC transporter permease subunit [Geminicoccaceae bacterium]